MGHATLVNDGLFWFVILLTLLLLMFICAVIATPPEDAVRTEPPTLNAPAPPPPAPAAALPAGRPQALPSPAGAARRSGGAGYAARHTPAAAPAISRPKVSSGPAWRPVLASILVIAGLAMAVIGGWLLLSRGQTATPCSHHAVAVCLQGFVLFNATQLLGGAIAVAGIALVVTALLLALRLVAGAVAAPSARRPAPRTSPEMTKRQRPGKRPV
jgi:hypothetical protein